MGMRVRSEGGVGWFIPVTTNRWGGVGVYMTVIAVQTFPTGTRTVVNLYRSQSYRRGTDVNKHRATMGTGTSPYRNEIISKNYLLPTFYIEKCISDAMRIWQYNHLSSE